MDTSSSGTSGVDLKKRFDAFLSSPEVSNLFRSFLESTFSLENLTFVEEVDEYEKVSIHPYYIHPSRSPKPTQLFCSLVQMKFSIHIWEAMQKIRFVNWNAYFGDSDRSIYLPNI